MNRTPFLIALPLAAIVGCSSPEKPSIKSDDPSLKIPAFKEAAAAKDQSAIPYLVKSLDSDDPAVRLYAINSLREITGMSFDYRYYDDEIQRMPALKRWQAWLAEREASTRPAPPRNQTTRSMP